MTNSLLTVLAGVVCLGSSHHLCAATIQTTGAGSAVTSIDRSATFDNLDFTHNGTTLSDYSEGSLFIRVDGDSFAGNGLASWPLFNPFHLPATSATPPDPSFYYNGGGFYFPIDGSQGWVTLETTDGKTLFGVEFLYGNGWTTGDIDGLRTGYPWGNNGATVEWETLKNGNPVSSGTIGVAPILEMGTVLGFYDPDGFDQLLVRSRDANSIDPGLQALALDDLYVQLSPGVPNPGVPDGGSTLVLLGGVLGLMCTISRRIRASHSD